MFSFLYLTQNKTFILYTYNIGNIIVSIQIVLNTFENFLILFWEILSNFVLSILNILSTIICKRKEK